MNHNLNQKLNLERLEQEAAALTKNEPQTDFLLKRLKRHHLPTYRQSLWTAHYASLLAKALDYSDEEERRLYRTALLQDIGKLHIEADLLDNRHLPSEGLQRLQEHPKYSAGILEPMIASGAVDEEGVLYHHESLDGTGYPFGLTFDSISRNARILRIADNYAIMTDPQASIGLRHEEALEELYRWSDILFDAGLAELMNELYRGQRLQGNRGKEMADYASVKRNRNS